VGYNFVRDMNDFFIQVFSSIWLPNIQNCGNDIIIEFKISIFSECILIIDLPLFTLYFSVGEAVLFLCTISKLSAPIWLFSSHLS
jgi:hypothetical protein